MQRLALVLLGPLLTLVLTTRSLAGELENELLASAANRLDVKGVELALKRGAKSDQALTHPDSPSVTKTPLQLTLSALLSERDELAPKKAEAILTALFKSGAKLRGDRDELFAVIARGYERLLKLLLDNGANPHAKIYGYTTAELAVKYGRTQLLPVLYGRGVPRVDSESEIQIRFVEAALLKDLAGMKAAVARGARPDVPDPSGKIAAVTIFFAPLQDRSDVEAVLWLVKEARVNLNVNDSSEFDSTPLTLAIQRNVLRREDEETATALADILIQHGADVSAPDGIGKTPLHYAAAAGNVLLIKLLITSGAKLMARDYRRRTPLDLAKSGSAISTLKEAGATE